MPNFQYPMFKLGKQPNIPSRAPLLVRVALSLPKGGKVVAERDVLSGVEVESKPAEGEAGLI